jgi:3'-phosphoadenosine 5'-phosphosulfate sulfotransferase (PAPS reductase)/FAD synthetase
MSNTAPMPHFCQTDVSGSTSIPRVFNFSGGKTSAYMTIHNWKQGDLVIFCDTGREHPKTYKFINDFEAFENIPVIRLSYYDSKDGFKALLEKKKYKVIPNRVKRFCTDELKIKVCKRYLRSIGIRRFENFIGFRIDEPLRIKRRVQKFVNVIDKFPLFEAGINKQMINEYFNNKPYNLEIPSILGNCTLCFMKGKNAIISILSLYPELGDVWINDENEAQKHGKFGGHTYFPNTTIEQLRNLAQNNLFKDMDLTEINPAFNCACTT